jgi:hypothetical protein
VEQETGANIIHNYGHGGSGFTLAFGCAAEVVRIVEVFKINIYDHSKKSRTKRLQAVAMN